LLSRDLVATAATATTVVFVVFLPFSVAIPAIVTLATATRSQEQRKTSHRRGHTQFEESFAAQGCFSLLHPSHFTTLVVKVSTFVTGVQNSWTSAAGKSFR
jgi:hypothetical protein